MIRACFRLVSASIVASAATGCLISTETAPKICTADTDCPTAQSYWCVSPSSFPQIPCQTNDTACTCELIFPQPQSGTPFTVDAGLPPTDAGVSFANDIVPIFTGNCSCHTIATPSGMMSLKPADAYASLVNTATSAGCNSGNSDRIVPDSLTTSMLYLKITDDPAKCNASMPDGLPPLSTSHPELVSKIQEWIQAGAPNN